MIATLSLPIMVFVVVRLQSIAMCLRVVQSLELLLHIIYCSTMK